MTTHPLLRQPRQPHRQNPFQAAPKPIPLSGWNLRALDIFRERPLADHIDRNAGWLQAHPHTSNAIEAALFPEFSPCGMEPEEIRRLMNRALWDAGYFPDCENTDNPTWTWTEGN